MKYEAITLEKTEAVATITLNRPEKLNALSDQMAEELMDVLAALADDSKTRAVIITGAGKGFCSGGDVVRISERAVKKQTEPKVVPLTRMVYKGCLLLRDMGKPIISAVNGVAIGFGFSVALASDIRIASEDARFGIGFVRVGMPPGFGATYFLPRLVGIEAALRFALTGKIIDAAEAKEMGLVSQVVPPAQLKSATMELAQSLAEGPPVAIRLTKQGLYQSLESSLSTQLEFESMARNILRQTADHKEAIQAIVEKRKPVFKGV